MTSPHRSLPLAIGLLVAFTIFSTLAIISSAQSLDVKNPAPLHAGANRATIDSFGSSHFWYFYAEPGHFHISFGAGEAQEGFTVGGRAISAAAYAPITPGATKITFKESPSSTTMDGAVTQRTRVIIEVDPKKSPLVRQTTEYALTVTGSASYAGGGAAAAGGGSPAAAIVGTYMAKLNNFGAAKFLPNGTIVASNGAHGTWCLFDANSRIYSVTLGGTRLTLTLQPGRGLIDTGSHNLVFEQQR